MKKENNLLLNIKTVVFDMDGTLYQLDGENSGFYGSSLQKAVFEKTLKLIMSEENCNLSKAELVLDEALNKNNSVGISVELGEKYGISRREYFDKTWSVNPGGIVSNFETPLKVVESLKDKRLILLTGAPSVWQKKVTNYLGISDFFEEIFTGEMYGFKKEIFMKLAKKYDPDTILSVGDQKSTDIRPAAEVGMKTFLVNSPDNLQKLI